MKIRLNCWEHFNCKEAECPVYGQESKRCWLEPGTRCNGEVQPLFADKVGRCLVCEIFRQTMDDTLVRETIDNLQTQPHSRIFESEGLGHEPTKGFFEVFEMLARLSKGDTTVRIATVSGSKLFNTMKLLLNNLAENMQEIIGNSHEMAIGLCEHYETLNRISVGDFTARSPEDSTNELVAKLGALINKEVDALTNALAQAKKAEGVRQSQLNFLQTLIDTIPSPIFYKDTAGRYLGCNKAYETYVGLSQDELVGKTAHGLWLRELADRYQQQDRELFESPGMQAYEDFIVYHDGTLRDVVFNKATFQENDGSVGGLVGVILDITERKLAEDALVFRNILLSTQQESSIDGILVVDEYANILSCNRRFVEIMGIPPQLLEMKDDRLALDFVAGRVVNPEHFLEKVRYLYAHQHETCRDEIALLDGTTLDRYSAPLHGPDGRYYGRLWTFRDITERKAAEKEIKDAYQQMLNIVEFLPDATFAVDMDKRVIAWNRAMERMTGVAKAEILGKGDYEYALPLYGVRRPILIDLLGKDDYDLSPHYSYVQKEDNTLFTQAVLPPLNNRDARFVSSTASPLFDNQGNQVGSIQSIRDLTESKRIEEEKTRLEVRLQHAGMIQSVMVQLGHDLKTPLTPLFTLLPIIGEQISDPKLKRMVDICCVNAHQINELTDKTLNFATLSSMLSSDKRQDIALAGAVKELLTANFGGIFCEYDIAPDIVVRTEPDQLNELLTNLISNAVRFSPVQGIVRITAEETATDVTIAIRDNGIGLAPEHAERIFDEFFKVDESRHEPATPGLGLSICKRIVQNHQGRIWAESPGKGKGTTIYFTLPRNTV